MVGTTGDVLNFLEVGDEEGGKLNFMRGVKSEDTIIALEEKIVRSKVIQQSKSRSTYPEGSPSIY